MLRVLIGYPLRRDFIVVALLGYHNKRNIRKKINLLALLAICIIVCLVLLVVFLLSGNMGFR